MTDATAFEREFYCLHRAVEDAKVENLAKTMLVHLYPFLERGDISGTDLCSGDFKTVQRKYDQLKFNETCTVEEYYQKHKNEYIKEVTGSEPDKPHIKLKCCPLCGATDSVIHVDKWKGVYIKCSNCPMQVRIEPLHQDPSVGNYLEGLIEAWNKRVDRDV